MTENYWYATEVGPTQRKPSGNSSRPQTDPSDMLDHTKVSRSFPMFAAMGPPPGLAQMPCEASTFPIPYQTIQSELPSNAASTIDNVGTGACGARVEAGGSEFYASPCPHAHRQEDQYQCESSLEFGSNPCFYSGPYYTCFDAGQSWPRPDLMYGSP